MSKLSPADTLVFIHLQRCGGSTLTNLLDLHFNNAAILKANLLHGEENGTIAGISGHSGAPLDLPHDFASYRLIAGHSNFEDVDAIVENPVYVTFMRDPVDRVVSLYRYWKSHRLAYIEQHDLRGPRLAKTLPLYEFVQSREPEALYNVQNGMTRQLLNHLIAPLDMPAAECLERAEANLSRFAFVGVTELYDLSVQLMCQSLGWAAPEQTDTANTHAQQFGSDEQFESIPEEDVDAKTAALIVEHNWIDQQLYQRVLKQLGKQCRAMESVTTRRRGAKESKRPLLLKKVARRLIRILDDYVHPV